MLEQHSEKPCQGSWYLRPDLHKVYEMSDRSSGEKDLFYSSYKVLLRLRRLCVTNLTVHLCLFSLSFAGNENGFHCFLSGFSPRMKIGRNWTELHTLPSLMMWYQCTIRPSTMSFVLQVLAARSTGRLQTSCMFPRSDVIATHSIFAWKAFWLTMWILIMRSWRLRQNWILKLLL